MKRQEELNDLTNKLYYLANKRISRREALSTASKIAIAATAASLAGGFTGYFLGSSLREEATRTLTETKYETQTERITETETKTLTTTTTKTQTTTTTKYFEEEALEWAQNNTPLTYDSLSKKLGKDLKRIGGKFVILARNSSTSFDQKVLSKELDREYANGIDYHPEFVYFSVHEGKLKGDFDQDGLPNELEFFSPSLNPLSPDLYYPASLSLALHAYLNKISEFRGKLSEYVSRVNELRRERGKENLEFVVNKWTQIVNDPSYKASTDSALKSLREVLAEIEEMKKALSALKNGELEKVREYNEKQINLTSSTLSGRPQQILSLLSQGLQTDSASILLKRLEGIAILHAELLDLYSKLLEGRIISHYWKRVGNDKVPCCDGVSTYYKEFMSMHQWNQTPGNAPGRLGERFVNWSNVYFNFPTYEAMLETEAISKEIDKQLDLSLSETNEEILLKPRIDLDRFPAVLPEYEDSFITFFDSNEQEILKEEAESKHAVLNFILRETENLEPKYKNMLKKAIDLYEKRGIMVNAEGILNILNLPATFNRCAVEYSIYPPTRVCYKRYDEKLLDLAEQEINSIRQQYGKELIDVTPKDISQILANENYVKKYGISYIEHYLLESWIFRLSGYPVRGYQISSANSLLVYITYPAYWDGNSYRIPSYRTSPYKGYTPIEFDIPISIGEKTYIHGVMALLKPSLNGTILTDYWSMVKDGKHL